MASLAVPRLLESLEPSTSVLLLLAAWPVACHAAVGLGSATARRRFTSDLTATARLLAFAGLAAFPLGLGLGFLVYWIASQGGDAAAAVEIMSPLVAVAGVPTLATGLLVRQRSAGERSEHAEASLPRPARARR